MYIKNEDICIRNVQETDCQILCDWWNDGEVMAHAGFPHGLGTSVQKIQEEIKDDSDTSRRRLIIDYKEVPIGEMSFTIYEDNEAEIGIKICNKEYQEKGIGTKALSMLIDQLFLTGTKLIFLDTNLKNKRAQHVYEKLGFEKTEIEYDSWKNQDGELQSVVYYELTPERFINLR